MNSITHLALVNYMQNLCAQSIHIPNNGFYRMDISEIEGAMRTGIGYPCFAMESHEGSFEGSQQNNSIDNKMFAFSILKKPTRGNFNEQNQFLDDCEIIGKKFLARMRHDARIPASILYNLFEASLVKYHKVGPMYIDGLYGYRFEVALKPDKANLKVEAADWEDIDLVC